MTLDRIREMRERFEGEDAARLAYNETSLAEAKARSQFWNSPEWRMQLESAVKEELERREHAEMEAMPRAG